MQSNRLKVDFQHGDIVSNICQGGQGLGGTKVVRWGTANTRERGHLVQKKIRKMEEEVRPRVVEMGAQGSWTRCETTERRLTRNELCRMEPFRIQFLLRSVYDVLPSPTNLHICGLTENPKCPLCNKLGSLEHVLTSCNVALSQGCYRAA